MKHETQPDTSGCVLPDPCFRVGPLSIVRVSKTGGCYRPNGLVVSTPAYCWEAQEKDRRR
jgi:hypothetical protein